MLKKLLLLIVIALIAFLSLGVYLNSQSTTKLNVLKDPLQTELNTNTLTFPTDILSFLENTSCPPISPHSSDLSKHLLLNRFESENPSSHLIKTLEKKSPEDFPQLDFSNLPIFIYQNTLYLAKINYDNPDDVATLQAISPKLANKIISCYFADKSIPTVSNFYLKSFQEDSSQRKAQLETEIADIQQRLQNPNLTPELKASFNSSLHARQTQLQNLDLHVGYFKQPDSIILILSDKHNSYPDRYLATLIHEHMHFISYTPNQRLERFFYDGLADYFTDEVLKTIGRSYAISYIEPVAIIKDMLNEISEKTFADFMFLNDQKGLETLIDQTYGQDFYQNHRQLFQATVDRLNNYQSAAEQIQDDINNASKN